MALFNHVEFDNHEQVVFCHDKESGLKAVIAIHSTKLGQAVGGCRMWDYATDEEALNDVLRLSKGMTYKNALAGLAMGGGKSVIIGDAKTIKSDALFHAFGRFIDSLGGRYVSAEDVNITTQDIGIAALETQHVTGLEGKSGNPAPFTALGTYLGLKSAVKHKLGKDSLKGVKVLVQGLGSVGQYLCEHLYKEGAKLYVNDINLTSVDKVCTAYLAEYVQPEDIYSLDVDVYAPCALGATINDDTIDQLKCSVIAGCANNQLAESRHGDELWQKGILYAPDYVINAGGIINVSFESDEFDYDATVATKKVEEIYNTLTTIFKRADEENNSTHLIADQMAREIIYG